MAEAGSEAIHPPRYRAIDRLVERHAYNRCISKTAAHVRPYGVP